MLDAVLLIALEAMDPGEIAQPNTEFTGDVIHTNFLGIYHHTAGTSCRPGLHLNECSLLVLFW